MEVAGACVDFLPPACSNTRMDAKQWRRGQIIGAALFIVGLLIVGGAGHEVSYSLSRPAPILHADLRGYQQARYWPDPQGNRVISAAQAHLFHVEHERHVMATKNRWDMSRWTPGKVSVLQAAGINWNLKYPTLNPTLPGQVAAVKASAGNTSGNISTGGAQGVRGLYNALRSAGASQAQAIGLIANAMNEAGPSLDPEARAKDTNGFFSNGLWQFNEESYPDSGTLVTGDPAADMQRQIRYLMNHGGLSAASGSTPQQVAGNFAANFEHCQGCQPGGEQYNSRVGNVAGILKELGL